MSYSIPFPTEEQAKTLADLLRKSLFDKFKLEVGHSKALEVVAYMYGQRNWTAFQALSRKKNLSLKRNTLPGSVWDLMETLREFPKDAPVHIGREIFVEPDPDGEGGWSGPAGIERESFSEYEIWENEQKGPLLLISEKAVPLSNNRKEKTPELSTPDKEQEAVSKSISVKDLAQVCIQENNFHPGFTMRLIDDTLVGDYVLDVKNSYIKKFSSELTNLTPSSIDKENIEHQAASEVESLIAGTSFVIDSVNCQWVSATQYLIVFELDLNDPDAEQSIKLICKR